MRIGVPVVGLVLWGCPSENPLLLEPSRAVDSMLISVLCAVPDGQSRQVAVGDTVVELAPGERTGIWLALRDSLPVRILRGGEQTQQVSIRLLRYMLHLLVVTATPAGRDTLALFLQPLAVRGASLRMLNVAATGYSYGLQFGCPNAPVVGGWVPPLGESSPVAVPVGRQVVVTVTESGANGQKALGPWRLQVSHEGAFSLLVWGAPGVPRVGLLDEHRPSAQRLQELEPVGSATARVRVLNLAAEPVSVIHRPTGRALAAGLTPRWVGPWVEVPVCEGTESDSISVETASGRTLLMATSLEPFREFTLVVMDSLGAHLRGWVGVSEPRSSQSAWLRLVHAAAELPPVRVVLGAVGSGARFTSGIVLAESLPFGAVSELLELPADQMPVLVQQRDFPSTVVAAVLQGYALGQSGLLCLVPAPPKPFGTELVWVEGRAEQSPVTVVPEGYPVQLLQAIPAATPVVDLLPTLKAVELPYRTLAVTVVPPQGAQLTVGSQRWELQLSPDSVPLLLITGTVEMPTLFRFATPRKWEGPWGAYRRFINASDVPAIDVVIDTLVAGQRSEYVLVRGLPQGGASGFELIPLEYRFSFRIRQSTTGALLVRVDNVLFPLGRRYSVIFVGNRSSGYSVVVHQEL